MNWVPATAADVPALTEFLSARAQTSMFPLTNLRDHGLGGDAPRALRVWLDREPDIRNALVVTNEGMLMPQTPAPNPEMFEGGRALLAGQNLIGAICEAGQARQWLRALGLLSAPTNLNDDEPGFSLSLANLVMPDAADAELRVLDATMRDLTREWRRIYHVETLGTPPAAAEGRAAEDIENYISKGQHRVLFRNDTPVAMTGFNAVLPHVVQIGAVFTPPDLRGQGHARLAVALHLAEACAAGVEQAVLFAASPAAVRAYESIGFRPADPVALVLFADPQEVHP